MLLRILYQLSIKICFTTLLLFLYSESTALHIIGGDVVYKCIGMDTINNRVRFRITFTMYRDSKSNGAAFDDPAAFAVYRKSGTRWNFVNQLSVNVVNIKPIDIATNNPCILVPANVGVESGEYIFELTLPIINDNYMIAYQRCCRNNTILNLIDPGSTGAAFTTEITPEAQNYCNNSPTFNGFPPVVICVNRPINFDHSATDIDGDSLVYEFCNPLTAGGTDGATTSGSAESCTGVTPNPINCQPPFALVEFKKPGFTFNAPMGGNPIISIDPVTGMIKGSPTVLGQYVVGVCVKEYRKGQLIGILQRDFQFNVTTCEVAVQADLKATSQNESEFNINSCGDFTIDFLNLSTDIRYIQNYYWEFDIKGKKEIYTTRNVSVTFPGLGSYKATMILNKDLPGGISECSDTASITINLYPSIDADYTYTFDTCVAKPIVFKDLSVSGAGPIQKWYWDFGEGVSNVQNPNYRFNTPGIKTTRLIVEDQNKCRDTLSKLIRYFPVPDLIIIDPSTFIGCQPANIVFDNLSSPIDSTYTFEWDFGDGNTSNKLSPNHEYKDEGVYSVKLKIISPIGCQTSTSWQNLIKIIPSPTAGFTFDPEKPDFYNNTVRFIDQSQSATSYLWVFDSLGISLVQNPTFTFRDTGWFNIQQIVLHSNGCSDTASTKIPILPIVDFYMPNAFTPNDDGLNDLFLPVGRFFGVRSYNFSIWNRWGDRVFNTTDFVNGWNGQRNNNGEISPPGVYAYTIEYIDAFGKQKSVKGQCTLIR